MLIPRLALKSLFNRRTSALLTVLTIAISVMLLLGVEKIRSETRRSFSRTVSGTDLIIGARGGPIPLLLASVFRIGDVSQGMSWESYQRFAGHSDVAWAIPLSLGDSHRGYRVLGTHQGYFQYYRFAGDRALSFDQGHPFAGLGEAVLGAEVAKALGYGLQSQLVISHGTGNTSFVNHDAHPFTVVGVLEPTGTPVDRTVHISLQGVGAIHGQSVTEQHIDQHSPISAALIGMKNRVLSFRLQREINQYAGEPLSAILPGLTLQSLWRLFQVAEYALLIVAAAVVVVGLLGMASSLLSGLRERRREMAILRSVGAGARVLVVLLISEAFFLSLIGTLAGMAMLYMGLLLSHQWIVIQFGLSIEPAWPSRLEMIYAGGVVLAAVLVAFIPSVTAYRLSLSDGLSIRT